MPGSVASDPLAEQGSEMPGVPLLDVSAHPVLTGNQATAASCAAPAGPRGPEGAVSLKQRVVQGQLLARQDPPPGLQDEGTGKPQDRIAGVVEEVAGMISP